MLATPLLLAGLCSWKATDQSFKWVQQCLTGCFDTGAERVKLRKFELTVSDEGFFRLRKHYVNGKQEYFSFNLRRFDELRYLGTTAAGTLILQTKADDIIVQTYNDPKGNIDSMATSLRLPVANMEPEQLDSLHRIMTASIKPE
jgi:hypothetical protein